MYTVAGHSLTSCIHPPDSGVQNTEIRTSCIYLLVSSSNHFTGDERSYVNLLHISEVPTEMVGIEKSRVFLFHRVDWEEGGGGEGV